MTEQQKAFIDATSDFMKEGFTGESTGHDWWHIYRVWQTSKKIALQEKADLFITEAAALLHDLDDWKFNDDDKPIKAEKWMRDQELAEEEIEKILQIIKQVSFKGAGVATPMSSLEGKVVQDADRLDALGAIGIARAFAYGGSRDRELYNPDKKPQNHDTFDAYKNDKGHTINHFYEKLLLLKDRMNTTTGQLMALERHAFMEVYLEQFYQEWGV